MSKGFENYNWKIMPQTKPRRVVLSLSSRFLSELFNQAIKKMDDVRVIEQTDSIEDLKMVLSNEQPEWAVLSLSENNEFSEEIETLTEQFPETRFLAVSPTLKVVKVKWKYLFTEEKKIEATTMDQLNDVFLGYPSIEKIETTEYT